MTTLRTLLLRAAALLAVLCAATPARAATSVITAGTAGGIFGSIANLVIDPNFVCRRGDGVVCTKTDLANPWYKQVLILPSGFAPTESGAFFTDFDRTVSLISNSSTAGTAWSVQKRSQTLYVGYFIGGGALGASNALFGGLVAPHPIRGYALSLSQDAVYSQVSSLRATGYAALNPFATIVMFNTFQTPITANASPPSLVHKSFGVAKFTRQDINERGAYVPSHELAHAGLNYLDEYIEGGFQDLSIKQIDVATPLALFDWTWGGFVNAISNMLGVYDYNISDILANNGNDNITTQRYPTTVGTAGYWGQDYAYEGGMFFGRGTWHQAGNNLMNSSSVMRGSDDGFGYGHSASQQQVINDAFNGSTSRPNDRIRTAGPKNGWPLALGSQTTVMLFDGDKNHHFHPTQTYTVQVGWYERVWKTCWAVFVPYPCYDDVWHTAEKQVWNEWRTIDLKLTSAYGIAKLAQKLVCAAGVNEIPTNGGKIRLCDTNLDTMANNFLPTLSFPVPYQSVQVPASQWFTTYWWRFSTNNGAIQSGMTGWSSFYRSF
ncbi:MAG: hypothetical protein JST92_15925 [Deltaproteobacteria bacterium]|nr:hypothetical protein [Deltaproteobacteria bacterium]